MVIKDGFPEALIFSLFNKYYFEEEIDKRL